MVISCTDRVARVTPVRNNLQPRYRTLSPDGLSTVPRTFASRSEAKSHLNQWVKRFTQQGYYKTAEGERIPVTDIVSRCAIVEVEK